MNTNSQPDPTANETADDVLTIGVISGRYNVTLRALRFYEDRGLLAPRRNGVTRLYDKLSVRRLELILKGKNLGFTLAEIREMLKKAMLDNSVNPELTLAPSQLLERIEALQRQRAGVDQAIAELEATWRRMSQADSPKSGSPPSSDDKSAGSHAA